MHPIISVFGDTELRTFPLLLVIGREPNTDHAMGTHIGGYDFRQHPRCGFWNIAYMLAARTAGMATWQLKQHCATLGASPILFADALPIGLRNNLPQKHLTRRNVPSNNIEAHISALFSHKDLLARVKMIILSGLYDSAFGAAKQQIIEHASAQERPCVELPFFHGVNSKRIQAQLQEQDQERIRAIISTFLSHQASSVA